MGNWENNQDALQMAILYFLHTFILAQTGDSSMSGNEFLMVEDGRYQVYLWGQIAFTKLMDSLRQDFNLNKQLYLLYGMPYALNNACSNIVPTPEELAAFDLTEDEHDPLSSLTTTSVNPKIVQPNNIADFVDFSTRPPRTVPFSVPDGPSTPAANVHGYADAQKVNYVIPDIEELKDHLKNYVDKKFEELLILIKENHSQLMLSRHKKNNKIDHNISNQQQMKRVSTLQPTYESTHVDTEANDPKKDNEAHQAPQALNEVNMDEDGADTVQHNIRHFMPFRITVDTSDSSTSTTISPSTEAAIDALVSDLGKVPIPAKPLCVYNPQDLNGSHDLLSDSQLPTDISTTEIVVRSHSKTHAARNMMSSRIIQSSYVTSFGSSDKGKHKLDDDVRMYFPFEGCGITYQPSSKLIDEYMQWLTKGLLKNHANKKPSEDKYRSKASSFEFEMMNFVVAFPINKNWFYAMSHPNKYWTDQHIDVVFYYLRKKSKLRNMNQYRYTTVNCLFISHIKNNYERSITNIIKGFEIPTALPWHLVDDVYIPVNYGGQFHWVLAVVELKNRVIRVYDSSLGSRKKQFRTR
ncbi:hypothetical protein KY285_027655 [Solanum tuberosum]|nr:hypothetical protein KY285_027655 [Solanum tuberosum]